MLSLSCEGQIDVWEMFSGNSHLSAIPDRQGLQVAAPIDMRTKKAESFSPQLLQGFWHKLKKKNPKIVLMSPTFETKSFKKKEVVWQQTKSFKKERSGTATVPFCLWTWQNIKFLAKNTSLFWDQNQERVGGEKKYNIFRKSTSANGPSCVAKKTSGCFTSLAIFCVHWRYCQPRVSEWFLQNGKYAQFLQIAYQEQNSYQLKRLSVGTMRQSATSWTLPWIKDQPEGSRLQNLALATRTGGVSSSLPRNLTADVHYALNKRESLGSRRQLILHGNLSAIARDFSSCMAVLRRHFFAESAFPVLCVASGHPRLRF